MWTLTRLTILRAVPPPARIIAIFGPTGVGKTEVALALAERLRAEGEDPVAVSADALQVYDGLGTLTGAAGPDEQARLEHRLVGFLPVTESFSAGAYAQRAHAEIDGALAAGRRPIVVGGTGLYLRAALADLDLRPPPDAGVRERWHAALTARGPAALHDLLAERAPAVAAGVAPSDGRRIVRALELLETGVEPPPAPGERLAAVDHRHPPSDAAGRPRDGPRRRSPSGSAAASTRWSRRARATRCCVPPRWARRRPPARRSASRSCSRAISRR